MTDYKETIFLPKTSFAMKANLREREPEILKYWQQQNIYKRLQEQNQGREKFVLHVGPPYANGHIHVGHAFNYILKDVLVRLNLLQGKNVPIVPGWDCHGLPIEWKIEESYRAKGKSKDEVSLTEFRHQCRTFAQGWIDVQREEFKRLGLLWDWENPYSTMDYSSEAATIEKLFMFLDNGSLYKGVKPVLWSVVEKTALAEAEVEYEDKTSHFVYVRFPLNTPESSDLYGASVIIWTTTPWTLPGNRALSYGPDIAYGLYQVTEITPESLAKIGEKILIATELMEGCAKTLGITSYQQLSTLDGKALEGLKAHHPFQGQGYDFEVPLIAGDHVTVDVGTGFVHTAPGHGIEDFEVCKIYGIGVPETVAEDGIYYPHVAMFAGQHIFKIDQVMKDALQTAGALIHQGKIFHSYPHSWRSKAPLIYRTTPQWFISMEKTNLRADCLEAIEKVRWVPTQGKNRIRGMLESCPDWCISRQRAWGVPIALFVDKRTGQPLNDLKVNQRIVNAVSQEGADAWFTSSPERFLGSDHDVKNFEQVKDILDVWFDSGTTQYFVLEKRPELDFPASLYLEGSDQHRGWFQSSLKVGCGTKGQAPYKTVLTHGFVLDEQGRKMSKSLGNVIAPEKIIDNQGAEILRLWVVSCDYTNDLRVGPTILKHQEDIYRRYRNTLRYLLGALEGFTEDEKVSYDHMPELEKWVLYRLTLVQDHFLKAVNDFELQTFYEILHFFCTDVLSAFYFDIRKDTLYCDSPKDDKRRAARTVMDLVFQALVHYLSPVLCFTAEEAWQSRHQNEKDSLQFSTLPDFLCHIPDSWRNEGLSKKYQNIRTLRSVLTHCLEEARKSKLIGSSLQAEVLIYDPNNLIPETHEFWEEMLIVSKVDISSNPEIKTRFTDINGSYNENFDYSIKLAPGDKCQRCWKVKQEVGQQQHKEVCARCDAVVETLAVEGKPE
ncbi:MAG: isoleucine--tRNA ligase [Janthinobacterium lividum]